MDIPAPGRYVLTRDRRPVTIDLLAAEDGGARPDTRNAEGWLWITFTVDGSSPMHWLALPEHLTPA